MDELSKWNISITRKKNRLPCSNSRSFRDNLTQCVSIKPETVTEYGSGMNQTAVPYLVSARGLSGCRGARRRPFLRRLGAVNNAFATVSQTHTFGGWGSLEDRYSSVGAPQSDWLISDWLFPFFWKFVFCTKTTTVHTYIYQRQWLVIRYIL